MILAQKDPATGEWRGWPSISRGELARRLDVQVEIVPFQSVGAMVDAAKTGAWDIAFMGSDPAREGEITFTSAYVELDATYLVPAGSRLQAVADVDRDGVKVAAPARANYELFLTRSLKHAQLVRGDDAGAAFDLLVSGKVDTLAGLSQQLHGLVGSSRDPACSRDGSSGCSSPWRFPSGRDAGVRYLRGFVEEAKASGLVAKAIEKTNARGVSVAPKAPTS